MSTTDNEADLSRLSSEQKMRRVHRMLVPRSVQVALDKLRETRQRQARLDWQIAALDRTWQWARSSDDIPTLRRHIMDSGRVGDLEAVHDAFRVPLEMHRRGGLDPSTLEDRPWPILIARDVIGTWRKHVREGPGGPDWSGP